MNDQSKETAMNQSSAPSPQVAEELPPWPAEWKYRTQFTREEVEARMRDAIAASRRAKRPMSPEIKAAIDEAHKTGATSAVTASGEAVFINYGHDLGDNAHLECTACGGSGHIEDQKLIAASLPDVAMPEQVMRLLRDAARAWNNESEHELDAAMESIECFLLDSRAAQPAEGSAQVAKHPPRVTPDMLKAQTDALDQLEEIADRREAMARRLGISSPAAVVRAAPADLSNRLRMAVRYNDSIEPRDILAACNELDRLLAAEGATPAGEWVSVDERLPGEQGHDSEEVLCFLSGHCKMTDFECRDGAGWGIRLGYFDAEKGMFRTHGRPDPSVTHWMPLPQAPRIDGDKHGEQGGGNA